MKNLGYVMVDSTVLREAAEDCKKRLEARWAKRKAYYAARYNTNWRAKLRALLRLRPLTEEEASSRWADLMFFALVTWSEFDSFEAATKLIKVASYAPQVTVSCAALALISKDFR